MDSIRSRISTTNICHGKSNNEKIEADLERIGSLLWSQRTSHLERESYICISLTGHLLVKKRRIQQVGRKKYK